MRFSSLNLCTLFSERLLSTVVCYGVMVPADDVLKCLEERIETAVYGGLNLLKDYKK